MRMCTDICVCVCVCVILNNHLTFSVMSNESCCTNSTVLLARNKTYTHIEMYHNKESVVYAMHASKNHYSN